MKIEFTLADRKLIKTMFDVESGVREFDTDSILKMGVITDVLDLQGAEDVIEHLLSERRKTLSRLKDKYDKAKTDEEREKLADEIREMSRLSFSDLKDAEPVTYELEKSEVEWLYNMAKEHKWNTRLVQERGGQYRAVPVTLPSDELKAILHLMETLKKALL